MENYEKIKLEAQALQNEIELLKNEYCKDEKQFNQNSVEKFMAVIEEKVENLGDLTKRGNK